MRIHVACTAMPSPMFLPNPRMYVPKTMSNILLFLSSLNISLKLIPADVLDLTISLHLKYIRSWNISPSPAIIAAVIRYSV